MKTILITAYAVNPYKGSEDGTGWNIISQIARHQKVIAITRKNNREAIEKYIQKNPEERYENITFQYFDLPYWMRFWKRKSRGALLYFFLWQLFVPLFVKLKKYKFDIVHGLNFHADWMPCFLWIFGKPFVWGPVGHHPEMPKDYTKIHGGIKAHIKERLKWLAKSAVMRFDPLLRLTVHHADYVLAVNSAVGSSLNLNKKNWQVLPAVGAKATVLDSVKTGNGLKILSVGRFVPLKGFDLTVLAFAAYYHKLSLNEKANTHLTLIGKGPMRKQLEQLIHEHLLEEAVSIIDWLPQQELFEAYRKADVFLFPSHEGAGMVIPEALSYALPVICLDNIGPGELIDDQSGIKVPYTQYQSTIQDLARAIQQISAPNRLRQFSAGAKHRFESYLDWREKGQQINQIYRALKLIS